MRRVTADPSWREVRKLTHAMAEYAPQPVEDQKMKHMRESNQTLRRKYKERRENDIKVEKFNKYMNDIKQKNKVDIYIYIYIFGLQCRLNVRP